MAAALHFPLSVSLSPPTLLLLRLLLQQQQQQSAPQPPKLTWLLTSFAGRLSVVSMAVVFAWLEITAQIVWLYSLISTALSSLFIFFSFVLSHSRDTVLSCPVRSPSLSVFLSASLTVCLCVRKSDAGGCCCCCRCRRLVCPPLSLSLLLPPSSSFAPGADYLSFVRSAHLSCEVVLHQWS